MPHRYRHTPRHHTSYTFCGVIYPNPDIVTLPTYPIFSILHIITGTGETKEEALRARGET